MEPYHKDQRRKTRVPNSESNSESNSNSKLNHRSVKYRSESRQPGSQQSAKSRLKKQAGQGLIEYLVIVALMAVATIGIVRALSQTVAAKFASATYALQGTKKSVRAESIDEGLYKKKDLSNFFNGAGKTDGGGKKD